MDVFFTVYYQCVEDLFQEIVHADTIARTVTIYLIGIFTGPRCVPGDVAVKQTVIIHECVRSPLLIGARCLCQAFYMERLADARIPFVPQSYRTGGVGINALHFLIRGGHDAFNQYDMRTNTYQPERRVLDVQ